MVYIVQSLIQLIICILDTELRFTFPDVITVNTVRCLSVDSLFPKRDLNLGPKEYVTQGQTSASTLDCSSLLKSAYK